MSKEQITQETVPVEKTSTEAQPQATQTTVANADTPISSTTTEQPTVAKSWKETISEEFRNDPNIQKFTEIDALAKSYINATKMIGQDKMVVPNNNFTEDQWSDAYSKMGRPESADKYSLNIKSDVIPFEETAIKSFQEQAHKLGLNNQQAQGVLDFYKNTTESSIQQSKVDTETAQAQAQQSLRQEWGREYDANISKAKSLAKANVSPEVLLMELKDGTRVGDHPEIVKGFAKIANLLSEDKIVSTEAENMDRSTDIQQEIDQIMNDKTGPYWNKSHPNHDKTVQQVYTLREMLSGTK
jgi:hypothetical protein|tara:strand:- start:284 stop:1180 length:897 start_codon:yes stop_codon:yes gene_type:complete